MDFRKQATRLEVPVYFLTGRHDITASPKLTEEYFNILTASHRELSWFKYSGNTPAMNESAKFATDEQDSEKELKIPFVIEVVKIGTIWEVKLN